jgi:hypothetical protein
MTTGKDKSIIFISCGQFAAHEKALGEKVAELVKQFTDCEPFFAEQQHDLAGVTENILKALYRSAAFIAIMHPRGQVSYASSATDKQVRGSVWIEQEIAIAAFVSQAMAKVLPVRVYVHEEIVLEGLRDKLHLNPQRFSNEADVIEDLKRFLPQWKSLGNNRSGLGLLLQARMKHQREQRTNWGETYSLHVTIKNLGSEPATDFLLDVWFPQIFLSNTRADPGISDPEKPGYLRFRVDNDQRRIRILHRGDETGNLLSIPYQVEDKILHLQRDTLKKPVIAQVRSGNMEPQITETPIESLRDEF